MKAVQQAEVDTKVANISFPDYTNYVLSKIDLAPDVGGGTIDLTVQGIRKILIQRNKVAPESVHISMVANHALRSVPPETLPHNIQIKIHDMDVTDQIDTNELIQSAVKATAHRFNANVTAGSGVQNLSGLLNETPIIRHSPGVLGLPGGIPVQLSRSGVSSQIPSTLTKDAVIRMNSEAMKPDGIERITADGTVIFTPTCVQLMDELLDIHWSQVKVNQTQEMTQDLITAYQRLSGK